jgi:Tfp pilus assembly protein FimT
MEVMLTLCLLAMVAALCWPPMARLLEAQRLGKAADQVRSRWYQARVKAVDCGETYVFQYVPGGSDYRLQPLSAESSGGGVSDSRANDSAAESQTGAASATGTLPEGVAFAAGEVTEGTALSAVASFEARSAGEPEWSDPILFYCDGTATSAKVTLVDQRGRAVEVALRGLTGVATVGEVFQLKESTP